MYFANTFFAELTYSWSISKTVALFIAVDSRYKLTLISYCSKNFITRRFLEILFCKSALFYIHYFHIHNEIKEFKMKAWDQSLMSQEYFPTAWGRVVNLRPGQAKISGRYGFQAVSGFQLGRAGPVMPNFISIGIFEWFLKKIWT